MSKSMEEQESLTYRHYSYTTYYVQSPTTHDHGSEFESPTRTDTAPLFKTIDVDDFPRSSAALSRYSADSSFCYDEDHQKELMMIKGVNRRLVIMDDSTVNEAESEYWSSGGSRYFSFRSSDSGWWIALQMGWRFLLSLGVGLLVFYLATQPPPPKFYVQISRVGEFTLGEGVDSHGVTTKILTCNCSIKLMVENQSKVFGLHIHPPPLSFAFGHIVFATSHGPKLYAESRDSTAFGLQIGTKNKAMYGAGREMADMLRSRQGLHLTIRMSLVSNFRVVWNIINPKFHHEAECLLILAYDERHNQIITADKSCRLVS